MHDDQGNDRSPAGPAGQLGQTRREVLAAPATPARTDAAGSAGAGGGGAGAAGAGADAADAAGAAGAGAAGAGGETRTVRLQRRYPAEVADVWEACTDPTRLGRWFLPVTGDLRLGGKYQLEGNAGGEILRCEPPRLLRVTWAFGDQPTTEVEVRLSPAGDGQTVLDLEHTGPVDPVFWAEYGPGAVGIGWDLTLFGLDLHLRDRNAPKPEGWEGSPEYREFVTLSGRAWGAAAEATGTPKAEADAAAERTIAFYAPTTPPS
jgi:uncharacterized protein YndB with AHSA1/START domain